MSDQTNTETVTVSLGGGLSAEFSIELTNVVPGPINSPLFTPLLAEEARLVEIYALRLIVAIIKGDSAEEQRLRLLIRTMREKPGPVTR